MRRHLVVAEAREPWNSSNLITRLEQGNVVANTAIAVRNNDGDFAEVFEDLRNIGIAKYGESVQLEMVCQLPWRCVCTYLEPLQFVEHGVLP
jgi:SepF-like predicted cell division protein (DUF552 family)